MLDEKKGRQFRAAPFVLALLCFFLPFIGQRRLKVAGDDYQFSGGLG
jgi:hypothetical protein